MIVFYTDDEKPNTTIGGKSSQSNQTLHSEGNETSHTSELDVDFFIPFRVCHLLSVKTKEGK